MTVLAVVIPPLVAITLLESVRGTLKEFAMPLFVKKDKKAMQIGSNTKNDLIVPDC